MTSSGCETCKHGVNPRPPYLKWRLEFLKNHRRQDQDLL